MAQKQILLFFLRAFDAVIENTKCQMTLKAFHEKKIKKKEKIERDIKKRKRERDRHGDGIREEDRKYKH